MTELILASGSRYRRQLLLRLVPRVRALAADIDERPLPGEPPPATAERLAQAKAEAVSGAHPGHLVIGSDQVADLNGQALGKPGSAAAASAQLHACSGRRVVFHTAVCVLDRGGRAHRHTDRTAVQFRPLTGAEIERYLAREQPFDCAGSFKVEGLGISLFDSVHTDDPTALVGLPLIATCRLLRACGVDPLA